MADNPYCENSYEVFLGLGQLQQSITEGEIRQIFCHFGKIIRVNLKPDSKMAFVHFAKERSARLAVTQGESYVRHARKDIGRIKIGNTVKRAVVSEKTSSDSESSSIEGAFRTLDVAYKCMTESSWKCPDPGCQEVNDIEQERCIKCNFNRDFPVAKSKQMLGKGLLPHTRSNSENRKISNEDGVIMPNSLPPGDCEILPKRERSKTNIDSQLTKLKDCCSSLLMFRSQGKSQFSSLNAAKCRRLHQQLISILENELSIRKHKGVVTVVETCEGVRNAYNFYLHCKESYDKECDITSRKHKQIILDTAAKELSHKLRGRLLGFPINEIQALCNNIDNYLENYPCEKVCLSKQVSENRIKIKTEDIEQKISDIKEIISINANSCKINQNLANDAIDDFARKLHEVAAYFERFSLGFNIQHLRQLPTLTESIEKAIAVAQKEETSWSNAADLSKNEIGLDADIELILQLQEDQKQSCKLYTVHKLMADDLQETNPHLPIIEATCVSEADNTEEIKMTKQSRQSLDKHCKAVTGSRCMRNSFENHSSKTKNLNEEDKEVGDILFCADSLLDKTWMSISNENRKEKLNRLKAVFSPCIFK